MERRSIMFGMVSPASYRWSVRMSQPSSSAAFSCFTPALIRALWSVLSEWVPPTLAADSFFFHSDTSYRFWGNGSRSILYVSLAVVRVRNVGSQRTIENRRFAEKTGPFFNGPVLEIVSVQVLPLNRQLSGALSGVSFSAQPSPVCASFGASDSTQVR